MIDEDFDRCADNPLLLRILWIKCDNREAEGLRDPGEIGRGAHPKKDLPELRIFEDATGCGVNDPTVSIDSPADVRSGDLDAVAGNPSFLVDAESVLKQEPDDAALGG